MDLVHLLLTDNNLTAHSENISKKCLQLVTLLQTHLKGGLLLREAAYASHHQFVTSAFILMLATGLWTVRCHLTSYGPQGIFQAGTLGRRRALRTMHA